MDQDWSKSHNGIMLCTFEQTRELMPEVLRGEITRLECGGTDD